MLKPCRHWRLVAEFGNYNCSRPCRQCGRGLTGDKYLHEVVSAWIPSAENSGYACVWPANANLHVTCFVLFLFSNYFLPLLM